MIQRAQPLASVTCDCGRSPALGSSRGCPGTRFHVECARCEIRTPKYRQSAEAIRAWTSSNTAAPARAPSPIPQDSGPGAAVLTFRKTA